jgi:uncharacterized integral membrane protein
MCGTLWPVNKSAPTKLFVMLRLVRILLIILGSLLIAINVLALVIQFEKFVRSISEMEDTAEKVGGILGTIFLGVIGGILLVTARRIGKKLEHKKAQKDVEEFLS